MEGRGKYAEEVDEGDMRESLSIHELGGRGHHVVLKRMKFCGTFLGRDANQILFNESGVYSEEQEDDGEDDDDREQSLPLSRNGARAGISSGGTLKNE
jgi:hypothetical protein